MMQDPEIPREPIDWDVLEAWASQRDWTRLLAWLRRNQEEDELPKRWRVGQWREIVARLDALRPRRGEPWPMELQEAWDSLLLTLFRFTRPDGTEMFGPGPASDDRLETWKRWARRAEDRGLATVVRFWLGKPRTPTDMPPPLPAFGSEKVPLAVLRADWSKDGDWAAIDGRAGQDDGLVEVAANGRRLIGPGWSTTTGEPGPNRVSRSIVWKTGPMADLAEWSFRTATASRITRSVVLLRGRKLALLADQIDGPEGVMGLEIPDEVAIGAIAESRGLTLSAGRGCVAQVYPLALPTSPYPTDRGSFVADGRQLVIRQKSEASRTWMPLLVSWDPARNRKPAKWRVLTVSEKSKICPPEVAFAARIGWGLGDGLVVYRSLSRSAPRAFLGHQTSSRFLIGQFSAEGHVIPLLSVDG